MPRFCVAANCTSLSGRDKVALFGFPLDRPNVLHKWVKFVQSKRANFPKATKFSNLCSDHFLPTNFVNMTQFKADFAKRLLLHKSAVPSVHKVGKVTRTASAAETTGGHFVCTIPQPVMTSYAHLFSSLPVLSSASERGNFETKINFFQILSSK